MRKKLTKREFDAVKVLLEGKASCAECAKYFKLSTATIHRIRSADNWDDYLQMLAAMALSQRERYEKRKEATRKNEQVCEQPTEPEEIKPEPQKIVPVPGQQLMNNYQINRLLEEMKMQNEHLKSISAKLAFIVESLA